MEQEIDLRTYAAVIARHAPLIAAVGLLSALAVAAVIFMLPRSYTATATVVVSIRQTVSQLGANEPLLAIETIDVGSRRQGLYRLAESSAVEAALPSDVLQQAAPTRYQPGMLVQQNTITTSSQGDLLEISAKAATPEDAQLLANAWAETYVAQVQQLYTDGNSQAQVAGQALLPIRADSSGLVRNSLLAGIAGALGATLFVIIRAALGTAAQVPRSVPQERAVGSPSISR